MEIQLSILFVAVVISLVAIIFSFFGCCGPTWTQRLGLCFAVLSIALGVFSSDIKPDMNLWVLKPYIDNCVVIFSLIGAIIGSIGELIWKLIHPQGKTRPEIFKEFVNS
ncbi:hypothetical protein BS056_RS22960 [Vibrio parahaemolyticus]|nr:hypothetical protein [Vibrio parahaemolyticus]